MSFDAKAFYEELDAYYSRYNNEETERFLLSSLDNVENSAYVASGCASCTDGDADGGVSAGERDWIISRSQGMIAILNELACFYRGAGRWGECIDAFTKLRKEMESCGLEETDNYALVTLNLAGAYRLMGKFEDALAAFVAAGKLIEKNGAKDPYSMASLYNNTGLVYQDMKEFAKAADCFAKALEYMPKTPENEAEIATSKNNLAMAYYGGGKQEKAEKALGEALEMFSKIDGGMNPHYAGCLNTKALFEFNKKEYAKAAELFELAVEKTRMIFGENHEFVIGCRNCALAYSRLGDSENEKKYTEMADAAESGR